ncbi:hypothetical protein EVAR_11844_1 [Eumeta japonica]|uniref:Uncharacterized protein n=1 Tax=Eumeta variegata TaxID=151549 RepID=A0A4C1YQQ7_EUMVA|nr:hypothetical protein EVAR_11844_1 [Eumeta japonica]
MTPINFGVGELPAPDSLRSVGQRPCRSIENDSSLSTKYRIDVKARPGDVTTADAAARSPERYPVLNAHRA